MASPQDPNALLFEFEVKDLALRWFIILERNGITSWEKIKQTFIEKYRDYWKARDTRDEIFMMVQGESESL